MESAKEKKDLGTVCCFVSCCFVCVFSMEGHEFKTCTPYLFDTPWDRTPSVIQTQKRRRTAVPATYHCSREVASQLRSESRNESDSGRIKTSITIMSTRHTCTVHAAQYIPFYLSCIHSIPCHFWCMPPSHTQTGWIYVCGRKQLTDPLSPTPPVSRVRVTAGRSRQLSRKWDIVS